MILHNLIPVVLGRERVTSQALYDVNLGNRTTTFGANPIVLSGAWTTLN